MIAQHTMPRPERIAVFENDGEFESYDSRTSEYTDGEPLVVATPVRRDAGLSQHYPVGCHDWCIAVHDKQTDIGYPSLTITSATAGGASNICLAIAHGVVAMRTEPSTVASI